MSNDKRKDYKREREKYFKNIEYKNSPLSKKRIQGITTNVLKTIGLL